VGAKAAAAHQVHHAFELLLSTALDSWIYEATATYEQYALYDVAELALARDALWGERLVGSARPMDDADGLFEYAGLTWSQYLVDAQGGEPTLLAIWQKMAQTGDVRRGHDAVLTGGMAEAFGHYVAWNEFACARDDGHHYAPSVSCDAQTQVPEQVATSYP